MKKNYTCPMVEVKAFDIEDVVMLVSAITPEQNIVDMSSGNTALNDVKSTFKANVGAATNNKGIVVEW